MYRQHLDCHYDHQRACPPGTSYCRLDRHRNDRLGGEQHRRLVEHGREIQSQHGLLDGHYHYKRAVSPKFSHGGLDRQRNDSLGRIYGHDF